jgi:hypothetical protein
MEFTTFGIFVSLALLLLLVAVLFFGPQLFLMILILPVMLSEEITGEYGTFSPNGSPKHSVKFKLLAVLFFALQVLLLAGIGYGVYRLFAGPLPAPAPAANDPQMLAPHQIRRMQLMNTTLLGIAGIFIVMLLVNLFRFREQVKRMTSQMIFFGYGLPLLAFPLAAVFLLASRSYLIHYPQGDSYLGFFPRLAAIAYVTYLVAGQITEVYRYRTVWQKYGTRPGGQYWVTSLISLGYKILFIYFVVLIFRSL